jgi:hypothetical protein
MTTILDHQVFGDGQIGSRGIWSLIGATIDDVFVSGRIPPETLDDTQLQVEIGSKSFGPQVLDPVTVDHIMLTGGFGSQPYIRACIESAARRDGNVGADKQFGYAKYSNLAGECVRTTNEPQLCVVMGLLDAHITQITVEAGVELDKGDRGNWLSRTWLRIVRHKD